MSNATVPGLLDGMGGYTPGSPAHKPEVQWCISFSNTRPYPQSHHTLQLHIIW